MGGDSSLPEEGEVNVTVMVPTLRVFCKKPFPSKPGDALSSAN